MTAPRRPCAGDIYVYAAPQRGERVTVLAVAYTDEVVFTASIDDTDAFDLSNITVESVGSFAAAYEFVRHDPDAIDGPPMQWRYREGATEIRADGASDLAAMYFSRTNRNLDFTSWLLAGGFDRVLERPLGSTEAAALSDALEAERKLQLALSDKDSRAAIAAKLAECNERNERIERLNAERRVHIARLEALGKPT